MINNIIVLFMSIQSISVCGIVPAVLNMPTLAFLLQKSFKTLHLSDKLPAPWTRNVDFDTSLG